MGRGSVTEAGDVRFYYVDEGGDPTLFSRKGRLLVGTPGCSRFFMLGFLHVEAPDALRADLDTLRAALLQDPYFRDVPSMQPEQGKTAVAFHAKDDLPEVRREVFAVLRKHELRFQAIIRDKHAIAHHEQFIRKVMEGVHQPNERRSIASREKYRYDPNALYDDLVARLFRNNLHKADRHEIFFATRGSSPRTSALQEALLRAKQNFYRRWNITSEAAAIVRPSTPRELTGLQAVDYFLWALQRMYERQEDRYVRLLWPGFRLVIDLDDKREKKYGTYYSQNKPLSLEAIEGRMGI